MTASSSPWRIALALAVGSAGGVVFWALALPLPWLLGAMIFTLLAVLSGAPVAPPEKARPTVSAVIGVMRGTAFGPEILGRLGDWALSLSVLVLYMAVAAAAVVPFYRRVGGMDPATAFFAAMPGGINEMTLIGESMGGDPRRIILAHAARIVLTIGAIAIAFRWWLGVDLTGVSRAAEAPPLDWADAALLVGSGVAGVALGYVARLPAPSLLGPMAVSALVHLLGWTSGAVPPWPVLVAQVVLGTIMGCRFLGTPTRMVLRSLVLSLGATALMLGISVGFAVAFHGFCGQSVAQVLLAYAPGGLTEMSLVALAMNADVAYISLHHIARISILIAVAPILLRLWSRRR